MGKIKGNRTFLVEGSYVAASTLKIIFLTTAIVQTKTAEELFGQANLVAENIGYCVLLPLIVVCWQNKNFRILSLENPRGLIIEQNPAFCCVYFKTLD